MNAAKAQDILLCKITVADQTYFFFDSLKVSRIRYEGKGNCNINT